LQLRLSSASLSNFKKFLTLSSQLHLNPSQSQSPAAPSALPRHYQQNVDSRLTELTGAQRRSHSARPANLDPSTKQSKASRPAKRTGSKSCQRRDSKLGNTTSAKYEEAKTRKFDEEQSARQNAFRENISDHVVEGLFNTYKHDDGDGEDGGWLK